MASLDTQTQRTSSAVEHGFGAFARLMALVALASGLVYWAQLTGIHGDPALRFDLLSPHARALFGTLAVLMPAAALGLWLVTRWGVVVWVMALCGEVAAYGIWADMFPARPWVAVLNTLALMALAGLAAAVLFGRYRAKSEEID